MEAAQGTSYYQMVKYQKLVSSIVVQDPDVESFYSSTGGGMFGGGRRNTGRIMVNLKPRRQREATVADIVNRLRPKVSNIPGIARLAVGSAGDPRRRAHVEEQLTISRSTGRIPQQLYTEAPKLEQVVAQLPGLQEVHQRSADQEAARQYRARPRPRRRPAT